MDKADTWPEEKMRDQFPGFYSDQPCLQSKLTVTYYHWYLDQSQLQQLSGTFNIVCKITKNVNPGQIYPSTGDQSVI